MDVTKLIKLMNLTTSTFDGEALNAIRKANLLLAESNISWAEFIKEKNITINKIVIKKPRDPEIEQMLKICKKGVRSSSGQMFIRSLANWYKNHGSLSEKQMEALKAWYDNV